MAVAVASTAQAGFPRGRHSVIFTGELLRENTSAKDLFQLKAGDIPIRLWVSNSTASNAGTNARISIGSTGTNTYFLADLDVKTAGALTNGTGQAHPSSVTNLGTALQFDTTVTGIYAEAGSASSTGGPFRVYMEVLTV